MAANGRIGVAVVGAGYWGINHVRVFANEAGSDLLWICDRSGDALERAARVAPDARRTADLEQVLDDDRVQAVVIATPAVTHSEVALQAIAAGKHALVEKPLALTVADAVAVRDAAAKAGTLVAVGHLLLYHPVVRKVKEMLDGGELGDLYYLYSRRVNLGRLRPDENALWSFAPHDISMIDYLVGVLPATVAARGECYLQPGVEDVVFVSMKFPTGQMAHIHLSWLDPRKERRLTLVGSQKMIEFDDVAAEKLRIYDKGYQAPPEFTQFEQYLTIRQGDIHIPHVRMTEPLAEECRHFLDCVRTGTTPYADIEGAIRGVQIMAAAQASLEQDGVPTRIDDPSAG